MNSSRPFNKLWEVNGKAKSNGTGWAKGLEEIRKVFPSPFKQPDLLSGMVTQGLNNLENLKQEAGKSLLLIDPDQKQYRK